MKEKSFRFRESYGTAIRAMDDKQAGKFIKGICDYVFYNKLLQTKDSALNSTFSLIKTALDMESFYREKGKQGGRISAELRKRTQATLTLFTNLEKQACPIDELIKEVLEMAKDEEDDGEDGNNGISEKQPKM